MVLRWNCKKNVLRNKKSVIIILGDFSFLSNVNYENQTKIDFVWCRQANFQLKQN
jgi:hypothetical protein